MSLRDFSAADQGDPFEIDTSVAHPARVLLIAVLHFIQDADDPHGLVATLTDALAPGSHLAISNVTLDFCPAR